MFGYLYTNVAATWIDMDQTVGGLLLTAEAQVENQGDFI
jgi:hypothetical protein